MAMTESITDACATNRVKDSASGEAGNVCQYDRGRERFEEEDLK